MQKDDKEDDRRRNKILKNARVAAAKRAASVKAAAAVKSAKAAVKHAQK